MSFISRIVNFLKSLVQISTDDEASELEIEEFLARCRAENLEREREGQKAWIDYLAQRKTEKEKIEMDIKEAWKNIH